MIKPLETQVDEIVINTVERMKTVMKYAISETVEDAQTPVAKGGKMRVDTGFLRSSGVASINAAPRGPVKGDPNGRYVWEGETLTEALVKMEIGDTFYFGWTARYAKYREAFDGFLESSLQKWQTTVNAAVQRFRDKDMRK